MTNEDAPRELRVVDSTADDRAAHDTPEQLSLLPARLPARAPSRAPADVSSRFRLGRATCERGLRHVAEIKEVLARRQAAREEASVHRLPPRRRPAA